MRVGVLGLNQKLGSVREREALHRAILPLINSPSFLGMMPLVPIITCNRVEIYYSSFDLVESHSLILRILAASSSPPDLQKLYSFFERRCIQHLLQVLVGMDSALFGETEIQGQVRDCYDVARRRGGISEDLHLLFQRSLKGAKAIRNGVFFAHHGLAMMAEEIIRLSREWLFQGKRAKVLFIGASKTNQTIVRRMAQEPSRQLFFYSPSGHSCPASWDQASITLLHDPSSFGEMDLIIAATTTVVEKPLLLQRNKRLMIIDLSVPRVIDPSLALTEGIFLWNVDQLQKRIVERQRKPEEGLFSLEESIEEESAKICSYVHRRAKKGERYSKEVLFAR